ncbi:MAG: ABC transporter substrate-binding protein [Desulfobacterales bacterium]|nr:MAG: ABC transporter substrate-binding protein [Desulfobacterales bacterium]
MLKNIIIFIAAFLALLMMAETPGVDAAGSKDVLVIGMATSDIISLDPAKAFEFSGVGLDAQIYDRLLDFPAGRFDKPELSLAKSYEVSPDGKTWTFHLRKDVKFHSGNPLTAEDVVYSFQRVVILKDQPSFILTQFGITPESIKAVDKYTVQITLDQKYASGIFFSCLSAGVASIVDSKVVKQHVQKTDKYPDGDYGLTWLSRNSAGSGSFILRKWEKGDRVILDANADHFANPPKVKRVVIKEIVEATSRRLQVEKGDLDIAWEMYPDQIKALKQNKDLRIESIPATLIYYLGMNVTKGPLTDNRVRTAIRHAVNYGGLINNIMGGAARPINTFIPAGFAGYQDVSFYREDLEKARQLLKEAGYPDGFEITMDHGDQTPNPEIAQAIQNSLARVGIKVKLNKLISAQLWPKYRAQKHELILARWGPDYVDPHTNAQPFADYKAKQLCWRNVYYNDATSGLIQQAGQEMDNDKRIALYQKANTIIQQEGPYAMLFQPMYEHAVRNNIKDVYVAPMFDLWKLYTVRKE